MKKLVSIFVAIISIFLVSCSSPVNYTVDKEHKAKMEVIYNMINGLIEEDEETYLKAFESDYIENVKKTFDTLGAEYFSNIIGNGYMGADDFDGFVKSFFTQNSDALKMNYGEDVKVDLSFESVSETSIDSLATFIDDYSISYQLPKENIKTVWNTSVKFEVKGSENENESVYNFIILELKDGNFVLHPQSFLFTF